MIMAASLGVMPPFTESVNHQIYLKLGPSFADAAAHKGVLSPYWTSFSPSLVTLKEEVKPMKSMIAAVAPVATVATVHTVNAAGCLSGAALGAVAGHLVHHTFLGMFSGCAGGLIVHHMYAA
jgi:hypothetical protein